MLPRPRVVLSLPSIDSSAGPPGKDSDRARAAGARRRLLLAPEQHTLLAAGELDPYRGGAVLLDLDLVLVEGYKQSPLPKLVVLDAAGAALAPLLAGEFAPVLAVVGPGPRPAELPAALPYHPRDDIAGIAACVAAHLAVACAQRPLLGLLLAGGRSTRMGRDKAALAYGGQPQAARAAALLRGVCAETFVSVRPGQEPPAGLTDVPTLPDRFLDCGPMGGILSALFARPEAAWLVLACDLPFVTPATLAALLAGRRPERHASAFRSATDGFPEPLCAVYEPKSRFALLHFLALGYDCPRKVLINTRAALLDAADPHWLDNVNHPHEYAAAARQLAATPGSAGVLTRSTATP